ncbi:MAG: hypothetical protein JKY55_12335 [Aliivibrio sp.]|uniref:hypothetical protein n=1 Tax=Aliivibrio sp. TaxID=1872443 RepID=UPI001A4BF033|nr:hypothetical protein [Aliivibrio sp.]
MYESLKKHSTNFHLFIFAFDDKSYNLLNKLCLEYVTVVSLFELEDEALLSIKGDRTAGEYCWTCTPSVIKYSIEKYNLDNCTYLDADLFFFSNPSVLIDEMNDNSVLITEHRYTAVYDQAATSGKYCVQFMTFKNDHNGVKVLDWWRNACNEWCYNRLEDGKFGDQKYLDSWPSQFEGVHELQHLGGGVAPWNVQQYNFKEINGKIIATEKRTDQPFDLVFYHFHALKLLLNSKVDLGCYQLDNDVVRLLYKEYVLRLEAITSSLKDIDSTFDYNGVVELPFKLRGLVLMGKRYLKGTYNIFSVSKLKGL